MSRKTISIISYITIIGWLLSFIVYSNGGKSAFAQYHLKQSFGLGLLGTLFSSVCLVPIDSSLSILLWILGLSLSLFFVFGVYNAANQKKVPLPLIGFLFVTRFNFIKF